ncbi:Stf0 sulfotransferase family protein [Kordiimonas aestuarii]|uniref:Stf0 sulfotransferase family protein n=1 Tax=Kordiimonas aestuarii TaxID=1005925 RepID=UPI0021CF5356|nr:Stf0 sulfotransferase family protein [Kordiimonas aestuarii]
MFGGHDAHVKRTCDAIANVVETPAFEGPSYDDLTKLLICMTPRSGSQYLGSVLRDNGLGLAHEHFRYTGGSIEDVTRQFGLKTFEDFVRNRIEKNIAAGGVFSAKADWMQFLPVYYLGAFHHYFRSAHYVYLTRRDRLDQAISRYIATESRYFHTTYHAHKDAVELVPFSAAGIKAHLDHIMALENAWEQFFLSEGIAPLRIYYEDLASDTAGVLSSIFVFLGRERPADLLLETEFQIVRTGKNEAFKELFRRTRQEERATFTAEFTAEKTGEGS